MVNGAMQSERRVLTPKVLQTARSHYNCPQTARQLATGGSPFSCEGEAHESCMDGVPIENGGGDGTAASHWEKRVLYGELMVGTMQSTQVVAVSDITLAIFEDSGWWVRHCGQWTVGGDEHRECR